MRREMPNQTGVYPQRGLRELGTGSFISRSSRLQHVRTRHGCAFDFPCPQRAFGSPKTYKLDYEDYSFALVHQRVDLATASYPDYPSGLETSKGSHFRALVLCMLGGTMVLKEARMVVDSTKAGELAMR